MLAINNIFVKRSRNDARYTLISQGVHSVVLAAVEARAVAAELIRLADEIDAQKEPGT